VGDRYHTEALSTDLTELGTAVLTWKYTETGGILRTEAKRKMSCRAQSQDDSQTATFESWKAGRGEGGNVKQDKAAERRAEQLMK
jgi:hypothetical protein